MNPSSPLRVRMSVRELCENPAQLNAFLRAWKRIKALPPDNPNSFWNIASFHGEPFLPPKPPLPEGEPYWGGWCQHSNVLFPTWHRFYTLHLEQALRTVCPEDDVTMAYWDATSEKSLKEGIPKLLTADEVEIDGKIEPNPLRSYTLPKAIGEAEAAQYYAKPKGYETVRYPYSGIRSPMKAKLAAYAHNKRITTIYQNNEEAVAALNDNVKEWLNQGTPSCCNPNSVFSRYIKCLDASNYNTFSNVNSAAAKMEVSIEEPHNALHLAIGGLDMGRRQYGRIKGANGDMGENETASFDPIFFFHHCNIDRLFWVWQKKNGFTDNFEIDPNDKKGTNPTEGQGYTHGQAPGQDLSMDTLLYPFLAPNGVNVSSRDCINIETQLGYTYNIGSLDEVDYPKPETCALTVKYFTLENPVDVYSELLKADQQMNPSRLFFDVTNVRKLTTKPSQLLSGRFKWVGNYLLKVNNIDRDKYKGSFLVRSYYQRKDEQGFIGQYSILNRFERRNCKNCQLNRFVNAVFNLKLFVPNSPSKVRDFLVEIVSKNPDDVEQMITNLRSDVTYEEARRKGTDPEPYLTLHKVFTAKLNDATGGPTPAVVKPLAKL